MEGKYIKGSDIELVTSLILKLSTLEQARLQLYILLILGLMPKAEMDKLLEIKQNG